MRLPHDQQFHFPDGTSAASLDELRDKIEVISYDTFYHHVDASKNDFANWVRYILKDEWLADEMEKVESIVETVELLNDYLQPKSARQHFDAQDDMQSKIEKDIGFEPQEQSPEEPAPPSEPAPEFDLEAIRERAGLNEPAKQEEKPEPIVSEQTPTSEKEIQEETQPEKPEVSPHVSTHLRREKGETKEVESFHTDMHRLIVKDFVWGMFFGLLIGFFLARMLGI